MKLNGTFVTRDIAGEIVIVPVGETALKYNGMITTTSTGAAIWEKLEKGVESKDELLEMLLDRFDVDRETAENDLEEFLKQLREADFIAE